MAEKDKFPKQPDKSKIIEKGQKPEKLNENKLPDFKFTPPPPPPAKKENNTDCED
jgi:hypothetical protein